MYIYYGSGSDMAGNDFSPLWRVLAGMTTDEQHRVGRLVEEVCNRRGIKHAEDDVDRIAISVARRTVKEVMARWMVGPDAAKATSQQQPFHV